MTHNYPDHLRADEAKIITEIISRAIEKDYLIRVQYDGDEWATDWTQDVPKIEAEVAATAYTVLHFATKPVGPIATIGKRVGIVLLVHGNGVEVVSDYTDKPEVEALVPADPTP